MHRLKLHALRLGRRPQLAPQLEALEERAVPTTLIPAGFSVTQTINGLNGATAMDLLPNGRILVAEQSGNLRVIDANGNLLATPFVSLNVDSDGERGLLGVTVGPNFASDQFVYVYYTVPGSGSTAPHNRVSRFTANGNVAVVGSERVIFELPALSSATNHNGGAIHFGPDGKLYIATGENNNGANAQSLSTTLGKVLRVNADGTIPTDNPFFNVTSGNNRAIYALGLRNPFTFGFDLETGKLYINDVGARSFEEINQGVPGGNYGWPNAEGPGGANGFIRPVFSYPRGTGTMAGNSIAGGAFYSPATDQFPSNAFAGDYFFADFINGWVRYYDPLTSEVQLLATNVGQGPVDIDVAPNGSLLVLSYGFGPNAGQVQRIEYRDNAFTSDQRFVQSLHADFLGRPATQAELNSWVNLIPTLGRSQVANDLARIPDAYRHQIDAIYMDVLGRPPAASEQNIWISNFNRGDAPGKLTITLLTLAEFEVRANAMIGGGNSNDNFVRAMHQILLNRPPNASEVGFYIGQLNSGMTRRDVARSVVQSYEYRSGAVRTFYTDPSVMRPYQPWYPNMLLRGAQPATIEVDSWVTLQLDLYSIAIRFAGLPEYSSRRS